MICKSQPPNKCNREVKAKVNVRQLNRRRSSKKIVLAFVVNNGARIETKQGRENGF
jgi:hypothetical protein